jgi:hypothetical protein
MDLRFVWCPQVQIPFCRRCVSAGALVLNCSPTNMAPTQKDQPLLSLKMRPYFKTHKCSRNEQKFSHESREGPKPRAVLLARASRSLLLFYAVRLVLPGTFCFVYFTKVSVSSLYGLEWHSDWWIGNYLEGSGRGLFKMLYTNFPGGTEENNVESNWGYPTSRPGFEWSTCPGYKSRELPV